MTSSASSRSSAWGGDVSVRFYNFTFDALPVTVHLRRDRRFAWTRILGVQLGPWFIGCIRGSAAQE